MTRKNSMDVLRILSTIAVVIIHCVTAPVANNAISVDADVSNGLALIHALMNWAVPVFFMITGYCLLSKEKCTYEYCFSHVLKYIGVLFTVGLFYAFLEEFFDTREVGLSTITQSLLRVIRGDLWAHMWFVYAIIGIYLVMPIFHSFMQQGERNIYILTGLHFVFNILCPTFEKWIHIGVDFPLKGYLFYVCFGGAVAKCKVGKGSLYTACLLAILSVVWIVTGIGRQTFGYEHLAVCLIAMSFFVVASRMDIPSSKLLLTISQCTWGIYLIHPFFINLAFKVLRLNLGTAIPYGKLALFAAVIFLCSLAVTYILRRIPLVRKLF